MSKNHVFLYNRGKVYDVEVLELKRKANSWNRVIKLIFGFTKEMLIVDSCTRQIHIW